MTARGPKIVFRHWRIGALTAALALVVSAGMGGQGAVSRAPEGASLDERVAFYVSRLSDRGYVEHWEHDGATITWYVAAEELGLVGVGAIPALIQRLRVSTNTYETQQVLYALRLAVQNQNATASVGTGYPMEPEAFPPPSAHSALKKRWLEWWSLHEQAIRAAAAAAATAPKGGSKGPVSTASRATQLVGTWRGTSTCVDLVHFPACKDEEVIYEARQTHSSPDTVAISADRIANGERLFMGDLPFTPKSDSTWVADVHMPRSHFLVTLRRAGNRLTGVMTDGVSGRRIRNIALKLVRHGESGAASSTQAPAAEPQEAAPDSVPGR